MRKEERASGNGGVGAPKEDADDFFENVAVPLHWVGPDGTLLRANQAELDMLGYAREEYIGHNIKEFHVDQPVISDILHRLKAGETLRDAPARLRAKDGSIRDVLMTSNVRWENGEFIHTRCVTRDITERKRAADVVREQAHRLEALNNIGKVLAAELDLKRLVQAVTDVATEVSGAAFGAFFYNVTHAKGDSYLLYTISGVPREAFSKFPQPRNTEVFAPTFAGTGVVRSDDITKDPRYGKNEPYRGQPRGHLPVRSYLAVPVVSRSGKVLGGLFFGHPESGVFTADSETIVTAIAAQAAIAMDNAYLYQAVQDQLAERTRAETALREVDQRKEQFLAMLAHELRNPLAPIQNGLQLLRYSQSDQEAMDRIQVMMERQITHLVRLVDDLLELSRISGGKIELRKELLELGPILTAALEMSRPSLETKRHKIRLELAALNAKVDGDPVRLAQVFSNLLTNAARFTSEGGEISLEARVSGDEIIVAVRDNGIGLSEAEIPRVFEMFWQAPVEPGQQRNGLGIGLALARNFTELHGGTIQARSEGRGRGATFEVRLPPATAARQSRDAALRGTSESFIRRRILVVDDNVDAAETLGALIRHLGHSVHIAHGGREGIAAAKTHSPDVMLLDLSMPDVDGFGVARALKKDPTFADLKIVAVTGLGHKNDVTLTKRAGFDEHLVKPVSRDVISGVIDRLTSDRASGQRLQ